MAQDKDMRGVEPEDLDHEFTEKYLEMARKTIKEDNPKLGAILEKYANGK